MITDLEKAMRQAIADPGAIAGRRRGPSWGRGADGYSPEQESVTDWSTRAVMGLLDQERALLPSDRHLATFVPGGEGHSCTAVIQLDGSDQIFRFMVNLLHQQVEFGAAGRSVLVELREYLTPDRFDPMARSLLGDDRYEKICDRFERNWNCQGCEKDIRVGMRYTPTPQAGAVCAECCRGIPEYKGKLVTRTKPTATVKADVL